MGTCRGGISLWDHWNRTFCLLTWCEGSSSGISSASQQRPPSCGISILFTWKTWRLWFSTCVFPAWWHQSKGLCDLTVSAAFTCEVGTQRVAPLASIYSVEREQRGRDLPRVAQQRCRQLSIVHCSLHRALEFIFNLSSCCCVIIWAFIKKKKKSKKGCNCDIVKNKKMCWRTERIRMQTRTYVMSRTNMLLSTSWLFWSRGTHSFNVVNDGGEGCALKFSSLLKMLLFTCTVLRVALATALMGQWCGWRHPKNPWTKGKKNSPNSSDLVFCSHRHHGLLIWITEGGKRVALKSHNFFSRSPPFISHTTPAAGGILIGWQSGMLAGQCLICVTTI